MNERNVVWNDELKLRLIKHAASQELGISAPELEQRLQGLSNLLPGLGPRLAAAPPKLVARLAADTGAVASRLLQLKAAFPEADMSTMVSNRMSLLLEDDLSDLAAVKARLQQLLPTIRTDRFVEAFPIVLDVDDFERALEDAKRILPAGTDVTTMLRTKPDMVLSLVKGKHMIPYDQIDNPWS